MQIKQWKDDYLAQFSYAIFSDCEKEIVLIDPARNPEPYLAYAAEKGGKIIGIIETHPHADFISSHLELHQLTGAPIYVHSLVKAAYPHTAFDDGETIVFGKIRLISLHTPGHSPDSISILLEHAGIPKSVFTGDTLFVGDCGRPDLRESAGYMKETRTELAKQMYHSLRNKLMPLGDDVVVYPCHGAGSLCGKGLGTADSSTIGSEKATNWCLQPATEKEFTEALLRDQPFVPAYFPNSVEMNRKGAPGFRDSVNAVKTGYIIQSKAAAEALDKQLWVVDARPENEYKKGHLRHSVNLPEGAKFETWLGSIIDPAESFYLAGEDNSQLLRLIERAASIGYEARIREAFILRYAEEKTTAIDLNDFKENTNAYTIVDVRNISEVKSGQPFPDSLSIPLADLRNRVAEIPTDKPIVVHCAGGSRSAAGSSVLQSVLGKEIKVFDLGPAVKEFNNPAACSLTDRKSVHSPS